MGTSAGLHATDSAHHTCSIGLHCADLALPVQWASGHLRCKCWHFHSYYWSCLHCLRFFYFTAFVSLSSALFLLHNFVFLFFPPFSSFVTLMPTLYHSSLGCYEKVFTAFKADSVYHLNVLLYYSNTVKHTVTPNSEHLGVSAVFPEKNGFHVSSLCRIPNKPINQPTKQLHGPEFFVCSRYFVGRSRNSLH